jgi:hypothetical protein
MSSRANRGLDQTTRLKARAVTGLCWFAKMRDTGEMYDTVPVGNCGLGLARQSPVSFMDALPRPPGPGELSAA